MTARATTPTPSANGELSLAERRAAARRAYRASLASEQPITGAELGRQFGQSARWGRDRIAEVKAGTHPDDEPADRDGEKHAREDLAGGRDDHILATETPTPSSGNATQVGATVEPVKWASATLRTPPLPDQNEWAPRPTEDDVPAVTPAVRRISILAVLAVALVAAIASYDHQRVLAEMAGEGWRAWMLPISVDGLVVAASMSMLVRRRAGLRTGALTWLALLAGIGASLGANVAAAEPSLVGRLVAAWPPLAFAVAFEMALRTRAVHHAAEGGPGR